VGIEPHQAHEGRITHEESGQRMHALDPNQGLQAIQQDGLDEGDHLTLDHRALDIAQPVAYSQLLQKWNTSSNNAPASTW
jgi:hypothetical protein